MERTRGIDKRSQLRCISTAYISDRTGFKTIQFISQLFNNMRGGGGVKKNEAAAIKRLEARTRTRMR